MSIGTFIAAIVAIFLFYSVFDLDNADTIITSTFLLGYIWHCVSPSSGFIGIFVVMRKKVIDHDLQDVMNTRICHRVKHLLAAPF